MTDRILLSAPDVRADERERILEAVDSNWIAPVGPALTAFESELAAATGRAHAVGLASGTAALQLALVQLGVGPGDEVLCSSLTFIGSAAPIVHCGAQPVFIDSESSSWNLSPQLLADELAACRERGKLPAAVVAVDLYGAAAEYDEICALLADEQIPLVEDAAEALGASYRGAPCGSFGESAILSFNGNKIITTSGGGAYVTNDAEAAERVRFLATQARENHVHYEHVEVGYNYRLSNLLAAFGSGQLAALPERIERRRSIASAYAGVVGPIVGVTLHEVPSHHAPNHWLSCILLSSEAPCTAEELRLHLEQHSIESRPVWKPMHLQPAFAAARSRTDGTGERLFREGLCLPSGSGMTDSQLERVIAALAAKLRV